MSKIEELRERGCYPGTEVVMLAPGEIAALLDVVEAQRDALIGHDPRSRLGDSPLSQADLMTVEALALFDAFDKGGQP